MYRVLYRKWRPRVFDDVVGQPQVTKPLLAEVRENRLSHAYLFVGSRGTGKTTCAKILSKAVNCLNPVNGNPCNACPICRGIDDGTVLDITEMDAASNRGIDDVRELRDAVNFLPSQAKYRVYIVDEVHMLTTEAFNALLKTLEEPPAHVIFILATTEVHKLPATILSRCQRFDFHRIAPETIAARLTYVAEQEGAALDPDAAMLIARVADGGMRDALSLLDRAIGVADRVTAEVVAASAGLMGRAHIFGLLNALAARDTAAALSLLNTLHQASCDTERLCVELADQFRSMLMIKTVAHPEDLIVCTPEDLDQLKTLAGRFETEEIFSALNVLSEAVQAIKRTQNRRIEAEMAVIRLCTPAAAASNEGLAARVAALERQIAELKAAGLRPAAPAAAPVQPAAAPVQPAAAPVQPAAAPVQPAAPAGAGAEKGAALPFEAPPPEDEAALFFDSPPPEAAAELLFDAPLPEAAAELPFGGPPPENRGRPFGAAGAAKPAARPFSGFANEPAAGSFQDRFSSDPGTDDAPFDFDAFMAEHSARAAAPAAAPAAPASAPKGAAAAASAVDERTWMRILLDAEQTQKSLTGILDGSAGETRGDVLVIRLREARLKFLTDEKLVSKCIAAAASRVLGGSYTIKIEYGGTTK